MTATIKRLDTASAALPSCPNSASSSSSCSTPPSTADTAKVAQTTLSLPSSSAAAEPHDFTQKDKDKRAWKKLKPSSPKKTEKSEKSEKNEKSNADLNAPQPVGALVELYSKCWDTRTKSFDRMNPTMEVNVKRFNSTLETYLGIFGSKIDYKTNLGFIEKRDIPASKLFVRADLHGDLKSLLENLKELKKQGLLDQNYRCAPGTHLVFLGDYMDRGDYSLQVLEILIRLKTENPEHVYLIRGNHENVNMNYALGDESLKRYLANPEDLVGQGSNFILKHVALLERVYETMPLTLYLAQVAEKQTQKKQYAQFTHGTVELNVDPADILDLDAPQGTMLIPKKRQLSERIKKIAGPFVNENLTTPDQVAEELKKRNAEYEALKKNEKQNGARIEQMAMAIAAYRIQVLATMLEAKIKSHSDEPLDYSAYNWGDMSTTTTQWENGRGLLTLTLNVIDIACYLLISSAKNSVGILFRGHQHLQMNHVYNNQVLVATLPIGMDAERTYVEQFGEQLDTAYILTTNVELKKWTKVALKRARGSSETSVTSPHPIHSNDLK